jgi:hypothetical protein
MHAERLKTCYTTRQLFKILLLGEGCVKLLNKGADRTRSESDLSFLYSFQLSESELSRIGI